MSAQDWPHCSVPAHLAGRNDILVDVTPALQRAPRLSDLLDLSAMDDPFFGDFEMRGSNGRPLGDPDFIDKIELQLGRSVRPLRRGRQPAARPEDDIF